ncbi:DUF1826 domain-containing protein [Thioclava sp. GXIMD4216]|uniref:DUF1826 domain-containing protein n=1 Tax=Thioclava sp. GXIMD4216 TaxID=3131929 RepID=UPI0030D2A9D8
MTHDLLDRLSTEDPEARYLAQGILQGSTANVLRSLKAPGVGASLWQRRLPAGLLDWLDHLPAARLPALRAECLALRDVTRVLERSFADARTPDGPERRAFQADIEYLVGVFVDMFPVTRLNLRLDVIENDACRRFHIDRLQARMLCTYRGEATQFALASGTQGTATDIMAQLGTGDVGLMRGTLWPGQEGSGVLHRSPPISGTGQTRLLLVIDPWEERPTRFH